MKNIRQELLNVLKPIVDCKVYNPNRSESFDTTRVINPKAVDLLQLQLLYRRIKQSQAVHYLPAYKERIGTNVDTEA